MLPCETTMLFDNREVPPHTQRNCLWDTRVQFLDLEDPLEKGMDTLSIFLPGEFHGQSSLVGYKSMGLQRVRHNGALNTFTIFTGIVNVGRRKQDMDTMTLGIKLRRAFSH